MREFVYLLAVPFASLTGLAAFAAWWSAALYVMALGLIAVAAIKRQEKHHRPDPYDDRLSVDRMEAAMDWLMKD